MIRRGINGRTIVAMGALLLFTPVSADADEINCAVRSIHGSQAKGGIDKKLAFLRKQLSRPPFSAFKSMKLVEMKEIQIPRGGTKPLKLPTGKILKLTFKEQILERKGKIRLRIHLSITPPKQKKFLPGTLYTIANRGTILIAGDRFHNGIMVVGLTCYTR
jgi:hypothetical protein